MGKARSPHDLRVTANDALNRIEMGRRRVRLLSRPVSLAIEPSNRCNSNCPMCTNPEFRVSASAAVGDMSWSTFERTRPLWRSARTVELSGNGEPFLNPRYLDMAAALKDAGCYTHCFSNAVLLTPAMSERLVALSFDRIGVSMGGATSDTYAAVRGIDGLDAVIENLTALRDAKRRHGVSKPEVTFNVAAMNSVLGELPELVRLAARLDVAGIDLFHLVVFYDHMRAESAWLDRESAVEHMREAGVLGERLGVRVGLPSFERREVFCRDPFRKFLVRWDGKVVSCVAHRFVLGDITAADPLAIWNGRPWVELRRRIAEEGYASLCPRCHQWRANDRELLLHAVPNTGDGTTDLRSFA